MDKIFYKLKNFDRKSWFTTKSGAEPIYSFKDNSIYVELEPIYYQDIDSPYGVGSRLYLETPKWFLDNLERVEDIKKKIKPKFISRLNFIWIIYINI